MIKISGSCRYQGLRVYGSTGLGVSDCSQYHSSTEMIPLIEGLAAWKLARGSQSRPSSVPEHKTCPGIPPAGVNGRSVSCTVHSQIPGLRHRGYMMPGDLAPPLSLSLLASDASPQCMDGPFDGPVP